MTSSEIEQFINRLELADKYGTKLKPGDICVYSENGKSTYCIFKEPCKSNKAARISGKFVTPFGINTLRTNSTVFASKTFCDAALEDTVVKDLINKYYTIK